MKFIRWKQEVPGYLFIPALLAGVAGVALWLAKVGLSGDFWLYFNTDTLYLPSLYQDLVEDGSGFRGWHLNAAPNFFPDMLLYGGVMWLMKEPATAYFIFALVQFALAGYLVHRVVKSWDPGAGNGTLLLVALGFSLFAFSPLLGEDPVIPYQLIAPAFHCGVFINNLLVMLAAAHYLRQGRVAPLAITGVLSLLAAASDRLFLAALLPPFFALALFASLKYRRAGRYWILFSVILLGSFAGLMIFRAISLGGAVTIIGTDWKMFNFANAGASLGHFVRHLGSVIATEPLQRWLIIPALLYPVAATVYLLRHLPRAAEKENTTEWDQGSQLILLLLVYTLAVLFTPVVNGSYLGPAHVRYNFPGLLMGFVGFIHLCMKWIKGWRFHLTATRGAIAIFSLFILGVITGTFIRHNVAGGIRSFTGYYPERAALLDSLKGTRGLEYGLAGYWAAKPATLFSREGTRVYPIYDRELKPNYHVTNENWFHNGGKGVHADPVFNFICVDTTKIDASLLGRIFGGRLDTVGIYYDEYIIKLPPFRIDRTTRTITLLE